MKKFFLNAAALLFIISCSSDSDEPIITNPETVVGVWKIVRSEVVSGKDKTTIISSDIANDCDLKSTYEFTSSNKLVSTEFELSNNICKSLGTSTSDYTYDAINKKITIDAELLNVEEVTNNSFIISSSYEDYNNDGIKDFNKDFLVRK